MVENLSIEKLYAIPLPQETRTYKPVSHIDIINLIQQKAVSAGLQQRGCTFLSARDGRQLVGYFDYNSTDDEMGIRVAFKNSYDKSMAFGVAIGANVFICSNGVVSGEIALKHKHVDDVNEEMFEKIHFGFDKIGDIFNNIKAVSTELKSVYIEPKRIYELSGKLFIEKGLINTVQMTELKTQLNKPEHFTSMWEDGFNGWDYYNAVTQTLKVSHPTTYLQDHIDFHQFMLEEVL